MLADLRCTCATYACEKVARCRPSSILSARQKFLWHRTPAKRHRPRRDRFSLPVPRPHETADRDVAEKSCDLLMRATRNARSSYIENCRDAVSRVEFGVSA